MNQNEASSSKNEFDWGLFAEESEEARSSIKNEEGLFTFLDEV